MPTIQQQIEAWTARLLDLSQRGSLLDVSVWDGTGQPTGSAAIRLRTPALPALLNSLVLPEQTLTLVPTATLAEEQPVTSDLPAEQLASALEMFRLRADAVRTDQGINLLFVALGLLEWSDSATPEQTRRSPLLLVPATLQRAPLETSYTLRGHAEDLVINPVLVDQLRQTHDLVLPDLPSLPDEHQPEPWFAQINEQIAVHEGWCVHPEVLLGLFTYLPLLAAQDLQQIAAHADAHPLVALLADDAPPPDAPELSPHDSLPAATANAIFDANTSQRTAIAAAQAGANIVVQAPPGTGKSETIANIIAECLAAEQRVLCVSPQMAALRSVYSHLRDGGLAEFCLELHEHRVSPQPLWDELSATLEQVDPPPEVDFPFDELEILRDQLNTYAQALHTPRGAADLTAHAVYARVSSLHDAPDCAVALGEIDTFTAMQLDRIDMLLQQVDTREALLAALPNNVWRGCAVKESSFGERGRIRNQLRTLIATVKELPPVAAAVAEQLGLPPPDGISATRVLATLVSMLREPHTTEIWLDSDPRQMQYLQFDIADARQRYTMLLDLETRLSQRYHVELTPNATTTLLDIDSADLLLRFTQDYANWLRYMRRSYYRDMATLRNVLLPGMLLSYRQAYADLRLASQMRAAHQRLQEIVPSVAAQAGALFAGRRTDWDALEATCEWTLRLQALPLPRPLPDILHRVARMPLAEREQFLAPARTLEAILAHFDAEVAEFALLFPPPAQLTDAFADLLSSGEELAPEAAEPAPDVPPDGAETLPPTPEIIVTTPEVAPPPPDPLNLKSPAVLLERMGDLDAWWEFCDLRRQAEGLGIASYLDALADGNPATAQPRRAFHKRFCQLWLEQAYQEWPQLADFEADAYAHLVSRFGQLDVEQLNAAQSRLRRTLRQRRAQARSSSTALDDDLARLRQALHSDPRGAALPLLRDMPALLGQLKPCLLLSPSAVSRLLPPEPDQFDLVIFDAASQIPIEEAIGAIGRSKALVVVGDSQQAPPIDPLQREDIPSLRQHSDEEVSESLLDSCVARGMPTYTLDWPYRRCHPALIGFANHHFYANRLLTIPVPSGNNGAPVSFDHVADAVFDRRAAAPNQAEVVRVADIVCDHVHATSEQSLGVVTFSAAQQVALWRELEQRLAHDDRLAVLFDTDRAEPFWVKHVADAAGHTRDVVIVSTLYGRNEQGRLLLNFGPLYREQGERWLNVALTRARCRVRLVSALLPDDIDPWRTKQAGLRLLREYIEYIQRDGVLPPAPPARRPAAENRFAQRQGEPTAFAPLEELLAQALAERGLQVERDLGTPPLQVDLAVRDPQNPERFVLGILTDGASYRLAETARDRERLREQVLLARGWRIARVWAAAWAHDSEKVLTRLVQMSTEE